MIRTLRMAEMTLRELLRRRGVLGLLLLVPLVFYLGRHDQAGQAVRFASLGVGFAVSTAALFSAVTGRQLAPRLALSGFRPRHLFLGRTLALTVAGLLVSALYAVVVTADQNVAHPQAVAAELALTTLVAVPLGLLLGLAVPRDLEGTLLLICVIGAQMVIDPAKPRRRCPSGPPGRSSPTPWTARPTVPSPPEPCTPSSWRRCSRWRAAR